MEIVEEQKKLTSVVEDTKIEEEMTFQESYCEKMEREFLEKKFEEKDIWRLRE